MKFNESSAEKGSQIFLNERSDLPLLGIYKKSRDNTNNCMKIFRFQQEGKTILPSDFLMLISKNFTC